MALKLERCKFPDGTSAEEFACTGPLATKDTEFSGNRMADLGCFQQEGVDSNKFYFCCITQHKKSKTWYLYVEYGRVGAPKPQFQFTQAANEQEAIRLYEKQCAEKNTRRGEWQTVSGLRLFRPIVKNGKPEDLYVVRDLAHREVQLVEARTICSDNHVATPKAAQTSKSKKSFRCDLESTKLLRDLIGTTKSYTRSSIQGGTIPTQKSLDEGRNILDKALDRLVVIGDDVKYQAGDHDLKQMTYALYSLVPKNKPRGASEETWILSRENIQQWRFDIDAFENALQTNEVEVDNVSDDPFSSMPFELEWLSPTSEIGAYIYKWWPSATRNHRKMRILHLWKIHRKGDEKEFVKHQSRIATELGAKGYNGEHRPLYQDKKRFDLTMEERKEFYKTNTVLLFHGTRTVNTAGILKENLRLPKQLRGVTINGAMFGDGLYFADDWFKSAGYTSLDNSYWVQGGGRVVGRKGFMFGCEVVLGAPYLAPQGKGFTGYPDGSHCIFGKGGYTLFKNPTNDKDWLANNEWITFDRRPLLKYLIEFEYS
jgi:hypothetical protein